MLQHWGHDLSEMLTLSTAQGLLLPWCGGMWAWWLWSIPSPGLRAGLRQHGQQSLLICSSSSCVPPQESPLRTRQEGAVTTGACGISAIITWGAR